MTAPSEAGSRQASAAREHDPVLVLRRLTKRFGQTVAVDGVDLEVRRGEVLTLLGPSGSGKSTILRLVAGFDIPTSGEIRLDGRDISRLAPAARGIGMVLQHYALFPHMSVADNVAYGLKMHGWPKNRRIERVREMLALVRLPHVASRSPSQLSGGQQQRIALARALAFDPKLLLMDEPLGALDRALRSEMEEEISRIRRELNTTILYVTHDQEEALDGLEQHDGRDQQLAAGDCHQRGHDPDARGSADRRVLGRHDAVRRPGVCPDPAAARPVPGRAEGA